MKRLNKTGETRQPCLTPEVTGIGFYNYRDFKQEVSIYTVEAFLRSTKATNVGNLFNFLAPMTKRWSRQEWSGLKKFCSSDRM